MTTASPSVAGRNLHYAWIVAAITFVTLLAAAGIRATPSVLIVPLEHEFGWSRASISFALSINLLLYGFAGPFSARRFGMANGTSIHPWPIAPGPP